MAVCCNRATRVDLHQPAMRPRSRHPRAGRRPEECHTLTQKPDPCSTAYRVGACYDLSVSASLIQRCTSPSAAKGLPSPTIEVPIPRPDGSTMLARLYRPLQSHAAEPLPALIWFHGGGWCVGDVASHDVLCRELSNRSAAILSVEYRPRPASLLRRAMMRDLPSTGSGRSCGRRRDRLPGDSAGLSP